MKPIPVQIETMLREALVAAQQADDLPAFDLPESIPVQRPKNPEQGDYYSPVAMSLAKVAQRKPLDIANAIVKHLPEHRIVDSVEVAAPGFINLRLSKTWIRNQIDAIVSTDIQFFQQDLGQGKRAQVEFVSANPTGPLTIGRTRGAIIGGMLANLLTECGWQVEREYYFNNAGRQMEKLGLSLKVRYLQALDQPAELPEDGYQGEYLMDIAAQLKSEVGAQWADKDWKPFKEYAEATIFKMIETTLARVSIKFDNFFNEQTVYDDNSVWDVLEKLRAGGDIYEDIVHEQASPEERAEAEGKNYKPATWFRSTTYGDDQDRVVVKSSNEPTYVLPDIAYHVNKLERGYDRVVDIFGTDHIVEAKTVSRGLTALGYDADKVDVLLHQFVTFGDNRMSTRKGHFVTLDDFIDEVGADAVRYFMIERSHNSQFDFDFDLTKKQSNENPVYYIQNAHVRCCGIFRQIIERGHPENWDEGADLTLLGDREIEFILKVLELPEQMVFAHDNLAPHQIAFYALDLARMFHPLYDEIRVLHTEVPEDVARARLRFYRAAKVAFHYALTLMGMSAPEVM